MVVSKPVLGGTRITVEMIFEKLAAGETVEQVLEAHPRSTKTRFPQRLRLPLTPPALHAEAVRYTR